MASKTFEDLDLSQEEIKRIETALKDEKFRKMFVEYAEEISNPENRKRYEEEIAMLERERGMDVEFINPTPGHVLKTTVDGGKKAFINICQNEKIAKPTSKRETSGGKRGLHWQIPHSFTPPREDFDKSKQTCMVYDVVFHPDTYRMTSNKAFLKLVEDTAIEGIERQFNVKLDRNNIRRPKLKSKGNLPATVIRNRKGDAEKSPKDGNDPLSGMPYPYGDKTSAELAAEKSISADKKAKTKENKTKSNMVIKEESGYTTPKFSILHRTDMDLQNYTNAPDSRPTTRPKELVISIELPLCNSAAGVDLDIFEEKLALMSDKPAYKLELKLPYPVDDENGSAKFDKSKKALVVTLPVIPGEIPKMPSFIDEVKTVDQTNDVPPLIEELPPLEDISETKEPAYEDLPPLEDIDQDHGSENIMQQAPVMKPSTVAYSLPEYTFSQDSETVTFVFHVRNIDDQSVSKSFASPGECLVRFVSVGSGGFPMHYSFYCKFEQGCSMVPEHCTTDIIGRNMTLTLLKQRDCRKLWNKFSVGVDCSSSQEKIFVTTDNLQAELDKLQTEGERMGVTDEHSPNSHAAAAADVKVTEMNEKKLTLNIRKATSSFSEEEEDLYCGDLPSSAGIEVVHSHAPPNLHGILKQRSVSESSEDPSSVSSVDSPTSLSPRDSDGSKRSVTFNSRVDQTTFKTNAAVSSMKQALKSKRKRNRQREEKKRNRENRKRHNSNGSEGSSCDEHDGRHSSESHSEDDPESEDLAKQLETTGKKIEDCGVIEEGHEEVEEKREITNEDSTNGDDESKKPGYQIQSENMSELESKASKLALQVKTKMAEKKSDVNDSDDDFGDENDERTIEKVEKQVLGTKVEDQEKDVNKTSNGSGKSEKSDACDLNLKEDMAAKKNSGGTTDSSDKTSAIKGDNPGKGSKKKGVKFDEDSKLEKGTEQGDGDKKCQEPAPQKSDVETELKWNETSKHDPNNEHRTQCAFNFTNSVMFDLDID